MSCGICQSYSDKYCVCESINRDNGQPIHTGRRSEELKIRLDKFNLFLDEINTNQSAEEAVFKIRNYLNSLSQVTK